MVFGTLYLQNHLFPLGWDDRNDPSMVFKRYTPKVFSGGLLGSPEHDDFQPPVHADFRGEPAVSLQGCTLICGPEGQ